MRGASRKILLGGGIILITAMATAKPGAGGVDRKRDGPAAPPLERVLLISGHSLTDLAYANALQKISQTQGRSMEFEVQAAPGSTLHDRFHGASKRMMGSSEVTDRAGMDQQAPALRYYLEKRVYSQMVVTEQHRLLDALLWDQTAQSLALTARQFHAHNPAAAIRFFIPWLSVSDRDNPAAWIRYERRAHDIWLCLVNDVNRHLKTTGTQNEIEPLPIALALASLAEQLTASPMLQGFQGLPISERMAQIFRDDVHLTQLGTLYTAMVSSAWIDGKVPELNKAWIDSRDRGQAEALQKIAAAFVDRYRLEQRSTEPCRAMQRWAFIAHYVRYTASTFDGVDMGAAAKIWRQLTRAIRFYWRFWDGLDAGIALSDKGKAGGGVLA